MKSLNSDDVNRAQRWLISLYAFFLSALYLPALSAHGDRQPPTFIVRSYQGTKKCLDYGGPWPGTGATVFLNDCGSSHPVRVEEINSRHEVVLHAGAQVIGFRVPVVTTTSAQAHATTGPYQLELESPTDLNVNGVEQVFTLDGDSIILATPRHSGQPDLVAQVLNARGTNGTPIVVAPRNLADSEFWDFRATNGSDIDPTSGFVRVSTRDDLLIAIYNINQAAQVNLSDLRCYGTFDSSLGCKAAWGSVIKIIGDGDMDLTANPAFIDLNATCTASKIPHPCCTGKATGTCVIGEGYTSSASSAGTYFNLVLPAGLTIRGDRRGINLGPLLIGKNYTNSSEVAFDQWNPHMIEVEGDYVRITNLRLQGPTDSTKPKSTQTQIDGIHIGNGNNENAGPGGISQFIGTLVDHNEVYEWTVGAVGAFGGVNQTVGLLSKPSVSCPATDLSLENRLLVARNFIHHNEQQGLGYGVVVGDGASATILGNTFLMNRHAIASDGTVNTQYNAVGNLVLSDVPDYGTLHHREQDFDMHGTLNTLGNVWGSIGRCIEGNCDQQHDGGYAGNKVDISWNTFMGGNRDNFDLRGKPCGATDSFSSNVTMQSSGSAIQVWDYNGKSGHVTSSNSEISIPAGNRFGVPNPTRQLAVGDFDGDGVQDIFLATGAGWYFSPGGTAGWRYLNTGKTDDIKNLLFGDFDRDGRTDVVGINGNNLMVSWGGISAWEKVNSLPKGASAADLAVGDFDGDGRSDIFYADGKNWYVSSGGTGPFNPAATSSFCVADLRFGHFSICGSKTETDVFGIVAGKWQVSCGARGEWKRLPVSLTNTVSGLVVADFDGDGNADIATSSQTLKSGIALWNWLFSHDAAAGWTVLSAASVPLTSAAAIGSFDSSPGADVLIWGDSSSPDTLSMASGGNPSTMKRWSIEEMR
ncbi:MAG: VCBS repeat-containing protein [Acidobacteriaceae bacterium]|nr:VCBS repeat-containing protein [Acidobacteriaceae bacterium]